MSIELKAKILLLFTAALALLVLSGPARAQGLSLGLGEDVELLAAEEAFAFEASLQAQDTIHASWSIADGYYMYKDKLSFAVQNADGTAKLGEFAWPKGKLKDDPLFGKVETYEGKIELTLPLSATSETVTLQVQGQGCNEPVGVCYPPIKHDIVLQTGNSDLVAATTIEPQASTLSATAPTASDELGSLDELRSLLSAEADQAEFLPVDEAFQIDVVLDEANQMMSYFNVADGYFLYQEKIKVVAQGASVGALPFPQGKRKNDEYFGEVTIHENSFSMPIPISKVQNGIQSLQVEVEYQGCAEDGICYPPTKKTFELPAMSLISAANAQSESAQVVGQQSDAQNTAIGNNGGGSKSLWWILAGAFVAGIGLTFTPCVLPLIPILSSVIAGQGEQISKAKAAWLAAIYVLGTAVVYAVMGAVAGATGDQLQAYFQNIWAIGTMAVIFVLMALSMFGLFEIQMPSFISSRLQEKSQGLGGSASMVFILGLFSALIVGACVSPVLISFLGIAIAQGSPSLGALTMFFMALGMGIPLVILAMGAGHWLPKAGMWMDKVKYVFGVMLLAVAIYLLGVLPQVPILLLWGALFIVVGIYLGAMQNLPEGASGWYKLFKGLGMVLLVWGVLAFIGGTLGQRDVLKPLPDNLFSAKGGAANTLGANEVHLFTRVNDESALDIHIGAAQQAGKIVMIDYYADWCVDCIRMEQTTFQDTAVLNEMEQRFLALQVDVTDPKDAARKALKTRFGVFGPPAVLFLDIEGQPMSGKSFYGYKDASEFLAHIQSL